MSRLMPPFMTLIAITVTLSGCASPTTNSTSPTNASSPSAASTPAASTTPSLDQVLESASTTPADRVKAIDQYVEKVESSLPQLTRHEKILKPTDLKGVTEASLEKLHGYFEGSSLKRVKTYPKAGQRKTEEFYFHNNQLVFVFVEPEGEGKEGDDKSAKGDRLYFDNSGLIAWYAMNGSAKDPAGTDFKTMGAKLVAEAATFRELVK